MKGYVMVGSSNLNTSRAFYDEVLAVLGIGSIYEDEVKTMLSLMKSYAEG